MGNNNLNVGKFSSIQPLPFIRGCAEWELGSEKINCYYKFFITSGRVFVN